MILKFIPKDLMAPEDRVEKWIEVEEVKILMTTGNLNITRHEGPEVTLRDAEPGTFQL